MLLKRSSVIALLAAVFTLSACTEEEMTRSQPVQPKPEPVAPAAVAAPEPEVVVPKHNLGRVEESKQVTPQQLDALKVGVTTEQQVKRLLGDVKPFSLGDGKHILRYDVGKFIFDQQGVLIRKFVSQ